MFDTPDTPSSDFLFDDIDLKPTESSVPLEAPEATVSLTVAPASKEALAGLYSTERTFPCSGRTELFFAPPGERRVRREKREATARSYCNQCSAKEMCKLAGRAGREHGIWGGENDEERAAAGYAPMFPHRKAIVRAAQDAKRRAPLSA